jgi:hypothetical protein
MAIEAAQHVVARHEVDTVLIDDRHADHVSARAPAPGDLAVPGHQAVEVVVVRADVDAIVERKHFVGRTTQLVGPLLCA